MSVAPGASPGTPNLLGLKILVVGMGIAIVASVIVIVVAVSNRLSEDEPLAQVGTTSPAKADAAGPAFGDLSIAVPEGCVMAEAGVEGQRLIVRLDGLAARGCQQVVLIDLTSGTVLGRVTAEPSP